MPAPLIYTLEVTLVTDDAGSQETFYFATRGFATKPADVPASTYFEPLIKNPGNLRSELFSGARTTGGVRPAFGEIELNNITGELDDWVDYGIAGGRVVVRFGPLFGAYPAAFATCYIGYAYAISVDTKTVKLKLRSRDYLLDKPVVTATFEGTGGLEGTGNTSTKKRLVFGEPGYIPLVPVDANRLIYFVQANATDGAMLLGFYQRTIPVDAGVHLSRASQYDNAAQLLGATPDPGFFRMWGGQEQVTTHGTGPVYIRVGSPPEGELRISPRGFLQNTPDEPIRWWRCTDLALRAGLSDVESNTVQLPGHYSPAAGNRVVEGDTSYTEVLNDVAAFNLAAWGFDRLDRWFTSQLLAPEETGDAEDLVAYEFNEHNVKGFSRSALPGQEAPTWQVNVAAGKAYPCPTLPGADATLRDVLSRDPWQAVFTGTNDDVKFANPGAVVADVQIQGNEFPDKASKQRWIDRYLYLYGRRSSLFTLTTERFSSVAQAEELLALDVLKKVRVTYPRFQCDAGVVMRIITVTRNLQDRNITLGLWSGPAGPATSVLGGGSSSASNGGGTGSRAFVVGVQYIPQVTQVAQSTVDSEAAGHQVQNIGLVTQVADSSVTSPTVDRVLHIHADGPSVTDDSSYGRTITVVGGAATSATQSKFGGKSLNIPGTSDYLTIADSADFAFGSGDWEIDFWIYPTTTPAASRIIVAHGNPSGAWAWALYLRTDLRLDFYHTRDGSTPYGGTMRSAVLSTGAWTHGHVARVGNTIRIGIAGAADATTSASGTTIYDPSVGLGIGAWNNGTESLNSDVYIDELSIVKGAHDIPGSGSFTPPVSAY